ncbi:MAG: hypothetical protein P4M08_10955 [Oligoflexia bacterium]|nr:hypothetical protein [Oligoflexia bacterium]
MKRNSSLFLVVFSLLSLPVFVQAGERDRQWHRSHWNEGHWIHDRHNGQLGWWWVIGGTWYYFAHPVSQPSTIIVQPQPVAPAPQVIIQQAPAAAPPVVVAPAPAPVTPTMYFCKATGTYYPETMSCPIAWTPVTAGAPPAP